MQLQGDNKILPMMYQNNETFQRKLTLFSAHMSTNNFLHFPSLARMVSAVDTGHQVCNAQGFGGILDTLAQEFEQRFSECRALKSLFELILNPLSFNPDKLSEVLPPENVGAGQLELLELQNDGYINASVEGSPRECLLLWKAASVPKTYSNLAKLAMKVFSMFGSTYRCESAFSYMKVIKSKYRNRITDENLLHCVRAATTKYEPIFADLIREKQCHGSH